MGANVETVLDSFQDVLAEICVWVSRQVVAPRLDIQGSTYVSQAGVDTGTWSGGLGCVL